MKPFSKLTGCRTILTIFLFCACRYSPAQMTPDTVVDIPMRDSKTLKADVFIPAGCDSCPTILIQTPYSRLPYRLSLPLFTGQNIDGSPYSWVVVDWRGFYDSAPAAVPQPKRGEDGYDVIEWIIAQNWNNGRVGTWGPSALGGIQYHTAKEKHPNHTCAVPLVAHPQQAYDSYFYGGVLEKARLEQLDSLGYGLSPIVLANPYYNTTWQFSELSTWYPSDITIPTLQTGGWYDHNIDKMMTWYEATRTLADTSVQDEQYLLIGPWVHGGTGTAYVGSPNQGELSYPNAAYKSDSIALDFFAFYLLDSANGWNILPNITYYELGMDQWNSTNNTGIEITNTDSMFLNPGGKLSGDMGSDSSVFISDPADPSPTIGGATLHPDLDQGPYDQISLQSRTDILTFISGELFNDVAVSGRVRLHLFVSCDQPDADISVRLVDVYPDGRHMLINDGIRRMRFRTGYAKSDESFMTTGQVYEVEVALPFVNYSWLTGHRIGVYIGGNSAIRWDVNLQNGDSMYVAGDTNIANISIHHSTQYPSRIILPGNNPKLGFANFGLSGRLLLFPNPATEFAEVPGVKDGAEYEMTSIGGKMIARGRLDTNRIDISGLPAGMYLVRVNVAGKVFSGKLLRGKD